MRMWGVGLVGVFLCLAAVEACSSSDSTTATTADAADAGQDVRRVVDSGTGTDAGSGDCTTLTVEGAPIVIEVADSGAGDGGDAGDAGGVPAATGGTPVDGTYVLTSVVTYGGTPPSNATARETVRLTGGTFEQTLEGSATYNVAGTSTTTGTTLKLVLTCVGGKDAKKVAAGVYSFPYDATPTTFTIYRTTIGGGTLANTYTKK